MTTKIAVFGAGTVGARVARQLLLPSESPFAQPSGVLVVTRRPERAKVLRSSFGSEVEVLDASSGEPTLGDDVGTVIIARAAGDQLQVATANLVAGRHVVATSDDPDEVEALLALGPVAESAGRNLVVGATMAPGLSCLLVAHAAELFDSVDEVHVAHHGAAGPGCARQRLKALRGTATEWRDSEWVKRPGFSGRELCWFPDPIGARDCYRAALVDPLVLVPALPGVSRVTARIAATRRDRALAPFPVLVPPPVEGGLGAVRVELRGERGGERKGVVYGALDRPAVAASAVAAVCALWISAGNAKAGVGGTASLGQAGTLLEELARRGVRAATFEGI